MTNGKKGYLKIIYEKEVHYIALNAIANLFTEYYNDLAQICVWLHSRKAIRFCVKGEQEKVNVNAFVDKIFRADKQKIFTFKAEGIFYCNLDSGK